MSIPYNGKFVAKLKYKSDLAWHFSKEEPSCGSLSPESLVICFSPYMAWDKQLYFCACPLIEFLKTKEKVIFRPHNFGILNAYILTLMDDKIEILHKKTKTIHYILENNNGKTIVKVATPEGVLSEVPDPFDKPKVGKPHKSAYDDVIRVLAEGGERALRG